jgi:hypothetical protein
MNGRICILILLGALALGLNSCGGGGGGGVGTISSSSGGTFSATPIIVESDVATWPGTPCAAGVIPTVSPDNVAVTFTAFAAPPGSTGNTPEQVVIDWVTISYSPASAGSPALPSQNQAIGQTVTLGSTATFQVQVASQSLKSSLEETLECSPNIYSYYATMVFACHYLITGDTFTGSTQINVKFADFAN